MNTRTPKLSFHKATGQFFIRWAGKCKYLGTDKTVARERYAEQLVRWAQWRRERVVRHSRPARKRLSVLDLVERFLDARALESHPRTLAFYRESLATFLHVYSEEPADSFDVRRLQAFKTWLLSQGFAARTVNHRLAAIKTMFQWAIDLEHLQPVNLRGVKAVRVPPPQPRGYSIQQARDLVRQCPPRVRPWLYVNWLALARPVEVVRLVAGEAIWLRRGVAELIVKSHRRNLILSERALWFLDQCESHWSRTDSYSRAVYRSCKGRPHWLRHGAAQHLSHQLGVDRVTVDLILGHALPRVSATYQPVDFGALRRAVARLAL